MKHLIIWWISTLRKETEFYKNCSKFMAKILKLFPHYFSFNNEVLQSVNFLELKAPYAIVRDKIMRFAKRFNLLGEDGVSQLHTELVKLYSDSMLRTYIEETNGNTLKLWDKIPCDNLPLLHRVAKTAFSLPTTSASIEQAFSVFKAI